MTDALGIIGLVSALAAVAIAAYKHQKLAIVLLSAFSLRAVAAAYHYYISPLPDGTTDAVTFERVAWELATGGILNIPANFDYSAAYIYSALMAVPYATLGRSPLMMQSFSVLIGTLCVYLTWRLAKEIWNDERCAIAAAWLTSLFPTLIMYSALTMREVYFYAILLLALIMTVRWAKDGRLPTAVGASALYTFAAAFHPASLAGLAALGALVLFHACWKLLSALHRGALHWPSLLITAVFCGALALMLVLNPAIPKAGRFLDLFQLETYVSVLSNRISGSAAYPAWLEPSSSIDLLWVVPARTVYLLFSPFLWDIRSTSHLVGLFDATLYLGLSAALMLNFKRIKRNNAALVVLLVALATVILLGIGTGNFGAALRHRAKIVMILTVLAVPALLLWRYHPRRSIRT